MVMATCKMKKNEQQQKDKRQEEEQALWTVLGELFCVD